VPDVIPGFVPGFLLGASLIIAIGAQNAFVLRQGLLRRHVFVVCLICALSDAVLITAGVAGLGTLIAASPELITAVSIGGALFLFVYGWRALRRAMHPQALEASADDGGNLRRAVLACLAFTWLNPHVYLDTVVLLGSLSARYEGSARIAFGVGAALSSFVWFFGLGYGARWLQPVFAKPRAWQALDLVIAMVMTWIGVSLLMPVWRALGS
jgi:L-lysine exporter family protein LysE/ArgO